MKLLTAEQKKQYETRCMELVKCWDAVNAAIVIYNEEVIEINGFRESIADSLEEKFDEKSEKWQESKKAEEFQGAIDSWREEVEEQDELELPELPETFFEI